MVNSAVAAPCAEIEIDRRSEGDLACRGNQPDGRELIAAEPCPDANDLAGIRVAYDESRSAQQSRERPVRSAPAVVESHDPSAAVDEHRLREPFLGVSREHPAEGLALGRAGLGEERRFEPLREQGCAHVHLAGRRAQGKLAIEPQVLSRHRDDSDDGAGDEG